MKAHRIYGVKNNIAYCHFPRGDNVMREIKIQCYVKSKKLKTYFGKDFKCIGINKWSFYIGDMECIVEQCKPMKFKVSDTNNTMFKNNQIAGVFYMNTLVSNNIDNKALFLEYVDDEIIRLQNCKIGPYRESDSALISCIKECPFTSPVTKQSARNREIISILCNEKSILKRYEIFARNQILLMNCNSWFNRFGKEYVLKHYIMSTPFFEKVFEFINQYFFASILTELASWSFSMDHSSNKTSVEVIIHKEKIEKADDIKYIIRTFQNDIIYVISDLLKTKKKKKIMKHLFGGSLRPIKILTHTIKEQPPKVYEKLYHKPGIYFME